MHLEVVYTNDAELELASLPPAERTAMLHAIDKLELVGDLLGHPHSSQVKGTNLRELRPRAGRSPWRAFYRRVGERFVVAAIGSEALHNPRAFRRAVDAALRRLEAYTPSED